MSTRFAVVAASAAVALMSAMRMAGAHSPPKAIGIQWFHDGRALIETNRGLIVEGNDAAFRIVCNDAYRSSLVEVPPVLAAPDGHVFVGTYAAGLLRSTADMCTFDAVQGPLAGLNTVDLQLDPLSATTMYSLTLPADGSAAHLWKSDDGGANFRALAALEGATTSLKIATGAPGRLYASSTGEDGEPLQAVVLTSTDAGHAFAASSFPLDPTEVRAYMLGVDPTDATRLFVRTETFDGVTPERLLQSRDGAHTFDVVLRSAGPLTMAVAPEGAAAWVGGADGLWRSRDHGDTFTAVPGAPTRISCLAVHEGRLYACGDLNGRAGVFVSADEGASFTRYLHFSDVRARLDCSGATSEGASCQVPFADWTLEQPYQPAALSPNAPNAPDGTAPGREAAVGEGSPSATGCAVSAARSKPSPFDAILAGLTGALLTMCVGSVRQLRSRRR